MRYQSTLTGGLQVSAVSGWSNKSIQTQFGPVDGSDRFAQSEETTRPR
jgi:hypothetical protein